MKFNVHKHTHVGRSLITEGSQRITTKGALVAQEQAIHKYELPSIFSSFLFSICLYECVCDVDGSFFSLAAFFRFRPLKSESANKHEWCVECLNVFCFSFLFTALFISRSLSIIFFWQNELWTHRLIWRYICLFMMRKFGNGIMIKYQRLHFIFIDVSCCLLFAFLWVFSVKCLKPYQ